MGKITWHEFTGNRLLLWILLVSGIGAPLGIVYLLENIVTLTDEVDEPAKLMEHFEARRAEARRAQREAP
ncbi:MAG: hypothetical protein GY851_01450 [bacterium]|nr:hypothetical protein [bacterium]